MAGLEAEVVESVASLVDPDRLICRRNRSPSGDAGVDPKILIGCPHQRAHQSAITGCRVIVSADDHDAPWAGIEELDLGLSDLRASQGPFECMRFGILLSLQRLTSSSSRPTKTLSPSI